MGDRFVLKSNVITTIISFHWLGFAGGPKDTSTGYNEFQLNE
jgi:hypothetical protein